MKQERTMPVMMAVSIGLHLAVLGGAGGLFASGLRLPLCAVDRHESMQAKTAASLLPEITVIGSLQQIPCQEKVLMPDVPAAAQEKDATVCVPLDAEPRRQIHSNSPAETAMLRYQDTVKQRIEQYRLYPAGARQQRLEGRVEVAFTVYRNGIAGGIHIRNSAGSKMLDSEAVATVKRSSPFLPIPPEIPADSILMRVAVVFSLR